MSRAFYGNDWDCVRLLSLFSLPNHEPVIVGGLRADSRGAWQLHVE